MEDIYKNIDKYNPRKKHKLLTVFSMVADMIRNKKLESIITELFICE